MFLPRKRWLGICPQGAPELTQRVRRIGWPPAVSLSLVSGVFLVPLLVQRSREGATIRGPRGGMRKLHAATGWEGHGGHRGARGRKLQTRVQGQAGPGVSWLRDQLLRLLLWCRGPRPPRRYRSPERERLLGGAAEQEGGCETPGTSLHAAPTRALNLRVSAWPCNLSKSLLLLSSDILPGLPGL